MPTPVSSPRSPGYYEARERLTAYRYVRSQAPRVRVRAVDPIVRGSLLALAAGVALLLLSAVLAPPA